MAYEFYVTIEGKQQGKFKGESKREVHKEKIAGLAFLYEIKSPRDSASGQASGKRQHGPITITKEWGAATPQLFQALVENEVLRTVLIEFISTNEQGAEEIYHTVKLSNATVSDIRQYTDNQSLLSSGRAGADHHELEDISFTFGRIEITNVPGKTIADDDWMLAGARP